MFGDAHQIFAAVQHPDLDQLHALHEPEVNQTADHPDHRGNDEMHRLGVDLDLLAQVEGTPPRLAPEPLVDSETADEIVFIFATHCKMLDESLPNRNLRYHSATKKPPSDCRKGFW